MNDEQLDPKSAEFGRRLRDERPVPRAAYRGDLRRHLVANLRKGERPARLRLAIGAWAGSGSALVAFAVAGLAGIGPFGA